MATELMLGGTSTVSEVCGRLLNFAGSPTKFSCSFNIELCDKCSTEFFKIYKHNKILYEVLYYKVLSLKTKYEKELNKDSI